MELKLNGNHFDDLLRIMRKVIGDLKSQDSRYANVDVVPISYFSYFRTDFFKRELKLCKGIHKFKKYLDTFMTSGIHIDSDQCIFIFMDNFKYITFKQLPQFLFLLYHEMRHRYQGFDEVDYPMYDYLCMMVENSVKRNSLFYDNYHDYFLSEFDASLFAARECIRFICENDFSLFKQIKGYLIRELSYCEFGYTHYNFDLIWNEFVCQEYRGNGLDEKLHKVLNAIFLDSSFQYRRIDDMFHHSSFNNVYLKFFYSVLVSDSFLSCIQLDKLNSSEIDYLRKAIMDWINDYKKRKQYDLKYSNSLYGKRKRYVLSVMKDEDNKKEKLMGVLEKLDNFDVTRREKR